MVIDMMASQIKGLICKPVSVGFFGGVYGVGCNLMLFLGLNSTFSWTLQIKGTKT
jgi:hypothetical protein